MPRLTTCLLLLLATGAQAQFNFIETENMRLIYIGGAPSYLVPHTARCFENALSFHRRLWHYTPSEKVTLVLHDFGDYGNAGASTIPRNRVSIGMAPISYAYETAPANERINATLNHEVMHIVAGDKACGRDYIFRTVFMGKVAAISDNPLSIIYSYLTSPRRSAPIWYHEGIAVFMETWMAGGLGRALGAYDEMVFRTMVLDGAHFYDIVSLESEGTKVDFQVGVNSYLYGTRFFSYLAYRYGPEKLVTWVSRTSGSRAYFAAQFNRTYGMSLDQTWTEWVAFEHRFQQTNLDSIRVYPTTKFRPLSRKALGSVSRAYYDSSDGTLYAAVYYPGRPAHIAAIDMVDGTMQRVCDVKGAALFYVTTPAYDNSSGNLFYTTDNNDWRDLRLVNTRTGRSRTLLKDARVGDLTFCAADSSLWGVRHFNGISTLVRIPYPYTEWNQIYSWPYGRDVYDIDISADGLRLSASLAEISGRQTLILMSVPELMNGDTTYTTLYDFGHSIPANFVFSSDGRFLFGSSYYSGVSNIFRYDFSRDSMEAVTNCETGFFRPIPISADSLIVFRYTGQGFVPVMIANDTIEDISPIVYLGQELVEKHQLLRDWVVGSPADIDLKALTIDSGRYRGVEHLGLSSAYPVVEGYKDEVALGMRFNVAEPLGLHKTSLTTSYSPTTELPENERWHVNWEYRYIDWRLSFKYNAADFYDLFGPTKTSRKGYSAGLGLRKSLYYDPPRHLDYSLRLTWYGNLQRLPDYQRISTSFDRFLSVSARIGYRNQRASIGAVDYERGIRWQVISSGTYVNGHAFPRVQNNFDIGLPLPIDHLSLWLRSSCGYSYGDRAEPFANFFFGGFGNNWVDYRAIKRYRMSHSFPGVELNEIGGTNYGRLTGELIFPPLRFRRLGFTSFYCTWMRLAVFSTGIVTNMHKKNVRRRLLNVGSQLDLRMIMLSHLSLTLSVGYALAFEEVGGRPSEELMVSLKVL